MKIKLINIKLIKIKKQTGITLLNFMISLFLATSIMTTALYGFQIVKKQSIKEKLYQKEATLKRLVFQFLGEDIRASGYWGCRSRDVFFPIKNNLNENNLIEHNMNQKYLKVISLPKDRRPVFGLNSKSGNCYLQGLPRKVCEMVKENSDILILYNIPKHVLPLKVNMNSKEDKLQTTIHSGMPSSAIALISDCKSADLFYANAIQNDIIFHQSGVFNKSSALSRQYHKEAEITLLQNYIYFLGKPDRYENIQNQNNLVENYQKSHYALYRVDFLENKLTEIIFGIVDLKIEYGFLKEKEIQYVEAHAIQDHEWQWVQGVKITLKTNPHQAVKEVKEVKKEVDNEFEFAIRNRHRISFLFNDFNGFFTCHFGTVNSNQHSQRDCA